MPWDKRQPYETDIRVPFLIRGPGVPKQLTEQYPIAAVDIAPTILDLATVDIPEDFDGESIKKRLFSTNEDLYWKKVLIEYWGEGNVATVDPRCDLAYDENLAVTYLIFLLERIVGLFFKAKFYQLKFLLFSQIF